MNSTDRNDFDLLMGKLCMGLGVKPEPARIQTYWDGLNGKMSIIQFARVVEHCLDEGGVDKMPKLPEVWKIWRQVKDKSRRAAPAQGDDTPPERTWGAMLVDSMFLTYVYQRRRVDLFTGDLHLEDRRIACRQLAEFWDGCRAEDMTPTLGECLEAFGATMRRIPDGVGAESQPKSLTGTSGVPIAAPGAFAAVF